MKAGEVRERQGEGGEGRKEREGGGRLKHEEGRLTDIAGITISSHTHIDVGSCILRQTGCCTVAGLLLSFVGPCPPSFLLL